MNELLEKIIILAEKEGFYTDKIKQELVILLSNYEITKKSTELIEYTADDYNQMILKKFVISKTVKGSTIKTIEQYTSRIKFMLNRINKAVNEITSDDINLYLAIRQVKDKISSVTASNEWRVMSSFFGWMQRNDLIEKNPMFKVEKPKTRKKQKKAFTRMECEQLRNACKSLRDKALIEVMLSTWCRVSEIAGMNIADIEGDQMTVIGKGEKERIVYLNARAQYALRAYLSSRKDNNSALFVSERGYSRLQKSGIESAMRKLGASAGVENTHPHKFRRTGATMALRSGMPIEKVSHLLGHESIETTQIYLSIEEDEAKQAHQKYVA